MIHVQIASLSVDSTSNQPVILLRPTDDESGGGRLVPIWIGQTEATAILLALQGIEPPRPMTHDLLRTVIDDLGAAITRVEVTRIEGGTFYATLVLSAADGSPVEIDARPSDSIALAVRTGAPIYLAEEVLAEAGVVEVVREDGEPGEAEEAEIERFREFLEDVDPSDFQG